MQRRALWAGTVRRRLPGNIPSRKSEKALELHLIESETALSQNAVDFRIADWEVVSKHIGQSAGGVGVASKLTLAHVVYGMAATSQVNWILAAGMEGALAFEAAKEN